MTDHVVLTDRTGAVTYANRAAEELTGYSIDEMLGKSPGQLWGGAMEKDFYKNMWEVISVKGDAFTGTVKNRKKDGSLFYAELRIYPVKNTENEIIGFISIELNVTERQQLEDTTALIIHRAKSPLSAESLLLEMMKQHNDNMTAEQLDLLKNIGETNDYMMDILRNLLVTTKLSSYPLGFHGQHTRLRDILENIVKGHAPLMKEKQIRAVYGKNLSKAVSTPYLLSHILENLVSNAVKYNRVGGSVELWARTSKTHIVVHCRDEGVGIPTEDHGSIFTPFFRASNVQGEHATSSGLGLYSAKQIAESLGYTLDFESEMGKGTTFMLSIPK